MKRFAVLCPGQGGQTAGMFAPTAKQAAAILPADLVAALADPQQLFANRYAQPLLVAVGMLRWQALRDRIPTPALIAGYSVGELTAYGVAGALDIIDLIGVARTRAESMDRCVDPTQPQVMLAVGGLARAEVLLLLQQHGLTIAIENDADRWVVGGLAQQALGLEQQVTARGGSCQLLPVTIASHTPLMHAARAVFASALAKSCWQAFSTPVLRGIDGAKIRDGVTARAALVDQLTSPIRWSDCMDACSEHGIQVVLELGPGAALSRLLRTRHPAITCRSIDEFRSVDAAATWLHQQLA